MENIISVEATSHPGSISEKCIIAQSVSSENTYSYKLS